MKESYFLYTCIVYTLGCQYSFPGNLSEYTHIFEWSILSNMFCGDSGTLIIDASLLEIVYMQFEKPPRMTKVSSVA